ncbi:hypothetical protein BU25DRAFT_453584 [Macroventuria anomochaeta]|uniref:Uncharacterized protein n=1 Tax=Macroventuria anomochaeta TaxID=301207 RepID=A0ACB6SIM3_9PLEO|nr:uncharacterized protein BU25DRAFT_453584 [Macroventuria anomochaeta]KAF2633873.1 hypothetical protein BU25DRAFT_453584 [Macroventuria anomochaeta]
MAILPRETLVAGGASAESSQFGRSSPYPKLTITLAVLIPVVAILGLLVCFCYRRKRRTKEDVIETEAVPSFKVLRVRKFVPNDDVEAGLWRVVGEEIPCASSSSTTTKNEESEARDDELARSRFSDKEVVQSTAHTGLVQESRPDEVETERTSLVNRIRKIRGVWPGPKKFNDTTSAAQSKTTLRVSSSTYKKDAGSSKGKEHLASEEVLGIDKRSMLQRLTDPHAHRSSHLRIAPANLDQSSTFVNPSDVEYAPNPVIFSHLYGSSNAFQPMPPISEVDATSKPKVQAKEPFELDAVDSEFNPWHHAPMPIVGKVPHRWEKTLGSNRMFFDAEAELMSGRKRRSLSDHHHSPEPPRRKRKLKLFKARSPRPTSDGTNSRLADKRSCTSFPDRSQDQAATSSKLSDLRQETDVFLSSESDLAHPNVWIPTAVPVSLPVVLPSAYPSLVLADEDHQW